MADLLRAVWDEPRPPHPPARVWRDWVLVAVLAPLSVLEGLLRPDLPWRTLSVVLSLALVPTLLWRRTRPLLMVAIAFTATGLAGALTTGEAPTTYTMSFLLILLYALYLWGSGRAMVVGSAIMLGKLALAPALDDLSVSGAVGGLLVVSTAAALGAALRYRSGARARELDQVKLVERERLARDLHDTVAHHVSAMVIRAQAGIAVAPTQPEAAVEALHVIEEEASRALAEMRTMVRVLRRDEPAELAPAPRIVDLHQFGNRPRSGPTVNVEIEGDADAVPASVGTAIYRLAQESVTNARRHARHASRIEVRVAADDSSVRLRVTDDGEPVPGRTATAGYGLLGMIERAGLLGGTCHAGPNADGGWSVTAVLPCTRSTGVPA